MTQRITYVTDTRIDNPLVDKLREVGFSVAIETPAVVRENLVISASNLFILDVVDVSEGIELLRTVRATAEMKDTLLMVVAEWGTGQATLALANGADAFERKPINASRLIAAVNRLLRNDLAMTATASED